MTKIFHWQHKCPSKYYWFTYKILVIIYLLEKQCDRKQESDKKAEREKERQIGSFPK